MKNLLPLAWIFLERLAVEYAAVLFLATLDAVGSPGAPLLEEERGVPTSASVTQATEPFYRCATCTRPTLATCYHPVDAVEVNVVHRSEQWLTAEELHVVAPDVAQSVDAVIVSAVLARRTEPHVLWQRMAQEVLLHAPRTLREYLIGVLRCLLNHSHHGVYPCVGHVFVEQVAH